MPLKQYDIPLLGLNCFFPLLSLTRPNCPHFPQALKLICDPSLSQNHVTFYFISTIRSPGSYYPNLPHSLAFSVSSSLWGQSIPHPVQGPSAPVHLISFLSGSFEPRTCYLSAPHLLLITPPPWNLWTGLRLPSSQKKKKKRSFLSQSSLTTHFSPTTALCLLFPYQSSLSFAPTTGPDIQQAAHKYLVHG